MRNKNKNGTALGVVLVLAFVFLLLGTVMLLAAGANMRQVQITHAVNVHFFEGESYLHSTIHDLRPLMVGPLEAAFINLIENHLLHSPTWTMQDGVLTTSSTDAPSELLQAINGAGGAALASGLQQAIYDIFNNAYATLGSTDDIDYFGIVDGIDGIHVSVFGADEGDNVRLSSSPHFTLFAISAGLRVEVDVEMSFSSTFTLMPLLGGVPTLPVPEGELAGFVPVAPGPNYTGAAECQRDCFRDPEDPTRPFYYCVRLDHLFVGENGILNNSNRDYILAEDIVLSGTNNLQPLGGNFAGRFNGNGNSIRGIHISGNGAIRGMFATLNHGAVIENLILEDVTVEGTGNDRGALAGRIFGDGAVVGAGVRIHNVRLHNIDVNGNHRVGGIAGDFMIGGADNSISYVQVTEARVNGTSWVGGIIGHLRPTYSDSVNGFVTLSNIHVETTIGDNGGIRGGYHTGGIAGRVQYGNVTVRHGYVAGRVQGHTRTGGAFGAINSTRYGANANRRGNIIEDVVSYANVYGLADAPTGSMHTNYMGYIGGFVGHLGYPTFNAYNTVLRRPNITRAASYGNVDAPMRYRVGGFAGTAQGAAQITDAYSVGSVTGMTPGVGGFVGNIWSWDPIRPTLTRTYSFGSTTTPFGSIFINTDNYVGGHTGWIQGGNPTFNGGNFASAFATPTNRFPGRASQEPVGIDGGIGTNSDPRPELRALLPNGSIAMHFPDTYPGWFDNNMPWNINPPGLPFLNFWSIPVDEDAAVGFTATFNANASFAGLSNLREVTVNPN
ncbi:MAG: hypothetical protein FWG63_06030 [Defluviitaleaceae bacterium]|nr:hypothetical protein [Defluviitaleaceae bacterium]